MKCLLGLGGFDSQGPAPPPPRFGSCAGPCETVRLVKFLPDQLKSDCKGPAMGIIIRGNRLHIGLLRNPSTGVQQFIRVSC